VRIAPVETTYGTTGVGLTHTVRWVSGLGALLATTRCV
jgi:hypothetical protein